MQTTRTNTRDTTNTDRNQTGGTPDWAGLIPVSIIALGAPSHPTERMMGAQSSVYRLIVALENIRLPKRLPSFRGLFGRGRQKLARNWNVSDFSGADADPT